MLLPHCFSRANNPLSNNVSLSIGCETLEDEGVNVTSMVEPELSTQQETKRTSETRMLNDEIRKRFGDQASKYNS
jgi:hypothetical protein